MKRWILFAAFALTVPVAADAAQRAENGHVVHTRRAPVVLHRMVPPFHGVHVYEGGRSSPKQEGAYETSRRARRR